MGDKRLQTSVKAPINASATSMLQRTALSAGCALGFNPCFPYFSKSHWPSIGQNQNTMNKKTTRHCTILVKLLSACAERLDRCFVIQLLSLWFMGSFFSKLVLIPNMVSQTCLLTLTFCCTLWGQNRLWRRSFWLLDLGWWASNFSFKGVF